MSLTLAGIFLFSAAAAFPCRESPQGRALDFRLGEWTVTSEDGATRYGENSIELAVGGCAILEHWRSATGGEGLLLFAFDARGGTWDQTWAPRTQAGRAA